MSDQIICAMTKVDWGALATLVTGIAAVGAAYWTVRRTEQAALTGATQREQAVAMRATAALEVAMHRVKCLLNGTDLNKGDILPWNAFSALSADIGLLGIDITRMYFNIERLAREAEQGARSDAQLKQLADAIEKLHKLCIARTTG